MQRQCSVLWNANEKAIHRSTLRRGPLPEERTGLPGASGIDWTLPVGREWQGGTDASSEIRWGQSLAP